MAFEKKHEGMKVMTNDGDEVGHIESTRGDTAHVKPESGLSQSIRQRLGWEGDEDTFELPYDNVDRVKGDEVHLKK